MESTLPTREPTVFVVDDDPAVRESLTMLVRSMELRVEAFDSAQAFLDAYDPSRPGCLLLDVRMPGISGLELLERLARDETHPTAVLISAYGDVPTVVRAMKAGAVNFLEKPYRDQQLWDAIQEALRRDADDRRLAAEKARLQHRLDQLTPGEAKVLDLLVQGKSNKAMAAALGLSVRTIEVRRAKVMRKMKAGSLAEMVQMVLSTRVPNETAN